MKRVYIETTNKQIQVHGSRKLFMTYITIMGYV